MASSSGEQEDHENAQNDESAKISQFQEFCAIEDEEIARRCLERVGWNLELAVQEFISESEGGTSLFPRDREGEENEQNQEQELRRRHQGTAPLPLHSPPISYAGLVSRGGIRRVGPPARRLGWAEWLYGIFLIPFRIARSVFSDIIGFVWSVFFRPRPAAVTDANGDVRKFVEEYEEKFGRVHPEFFVGSYGSALERAKKDLRFLLVYLHSPDHQDTVEFCEYTLANPDTVQFVNRNALFWAASVKTPEGYRVSTALRESTYPFLALICLRDNRMSMVLRQEGMCTSGEMIGFLAAAIEDNQPFLNMVRQEREQREMDSRLRSEQEELFRQSLKRDQERDRRKMEERQRVEEQEQLQLLRKQQQEQLTQELENLKDEIAREMVDEVEASVADVIRVSVKFPNGARLERRFRHTDSLEELFKVCLINENCPRNFALVTNFPRKVLNSRPKWAERFFTGNSGEGGSDATSSRTADAENSGLDDTCDTSSQNGNNSFNPIPSFADEGLKSSVMIFVQDNEA